MLLNSLKPPTHATLFGQRHARRRRRPCPGVTSCHSNGAHNTYHGTGQHSLGDTSHESYLCADTVESQRSNSGRWYTQPIRLAGALALSIVAGGFAARTAHAQSRSSPPEPVSISASYWDQPSVCPDVETPSAEDATDQQTGVKHDGLSPSSKSFRHATPTGYDIASADTAKKPKKSSRAVKEVTPEAAAKAEQLASEKANYRLRERQRQCAKVGEVPADIQRLIAEPKKDKKVDPTKMIVADPNTIPIESSEDVELPGTAWRSDKLRDMTYTQLWWLIQQRQISKVKYASDMRSVWVTTKATAPGGVRTEKVGLPFDTDFYEHMLEHGVFVEDPSPSVLGPVLAALLRFAAPLVAAHYLIQFSFRLGVKRQKDSLFGSARLDMVKNSDTTFADVAGVDQVKAEISEIVAFLRNPRKFLEMGARSPAGILLVGSPGTGKTLLAKAIAGESGVPFFSASGSEFMEIFVGVGASRIRDVFARARKAAPCILFIDEFDGLGKQRSATGGGDDESTTTINQLLTEMDGFDDNTGVVVMAATNRPAALDNALTRPGRFDRIISMPLPNLEGRKAIFAVHARGKQLEPDVNFDRIARATASFTGADIMNLVNQAAVLTVRLGRKKITEDDIFTALENLQAERLGYSVDANQSDEAVAPPQLRRSFAVYQAGCALIGAITPDYDEISKVVSTPSGVATGHVYFIPSEEHLESGITTRGFMESRMVVALAGRCAERLLLGDENVSSIGSSDLELANNISREMVFRCGFSSKLGPISLMDQEETYLGQSSTSAIGNVGTELARVAQSECEMLLDGAEAKAYYGLASNYDSLRALVTLLEEKEVVTGQELDKLLESTGAKMFDNGFTGGFSFDGNTGELDFPGKIDSQEEADVSDDSSSEQQRRSIHDDWHPLNPYQIRMDAADLLSKELVDL